MKNEIKNYVIVEKSTGWILAKVNSPKIAERIARVRFKDLLVIG
jgi:hypothetical protein